MLGMPRKSTLIVLQPKFQLNPYLDKGTAFQLGHNLSHGGAVSLVPVHALEREVVDNLGSVQAPPSLDVHDVRDREVCLVSLVVDVGHLKENLFLTVLPHTSHHL